MKEQPGYYAILPANVRYDKALKPMEKIMYAEITALSNKDGFCTASNRYFAELYEADEATVSRWISKLNAANYINVFITRNESMQVTGRQIFPAPLDQKINTPLDENVNTPIDKKVKVNNTSINNTSSICPVEEIAPLHIEVIAHLNSEAGTKYRSSSAKTKKAISARVAEGYTLDDFRAVIEDRVYRWKGDEKMSEYLRPETLFGPKFEGYLQAAQKADKPNADKALNDCEMTPQEEAGYAEYIKFIHANYMNLYRSECKVLSKADWRNYKGCLTHRGISTALTEQERRQLLARVHDKLNADANFRAKNKSVMDCYLSNARAIANRQTTTV